MTQTGEWAAAQVLEDYDRFVQHTYGRTPVVFVRGEGAWLWDSTGKAYLDWVSGGRGGTALGHRHPHVVAALKRQLDTLIYVSNDFHHPWGARLGRLLAERSGGRKAFFCNSGAEAGETALKLARKWGKARRGEECHEIITFEGSFHGRTLGALSATAQPKYQAAFRPVVPGFTYLPWEDAAALEGAVGPLTCAVYLEPVQGESGIFPASPDFMKAIERICRERDVLFMVDEVQTGFGRTGRFWAFEHYGVEPDVVTLAKALGGGIAVGACLAKPEACALAPGDHGCTFGGNPLAAAAGIAAIEALDQDRCLENAAAQGEYLLERFRRWARRWPAIREVRGLGLMLAIEFHGGQGALIQAACLERGLLLHTVGESILRILPPLILSRGEADQGLVLLEEAIAGAM